MGTKVPKGGSPRSVAARGMRCSSYAETTFSAEDVEKYEHAAAAALVTRGVRTGVEFYSPAYSTTTATGSR